MLERIGEAYHYAYRQLRNLYKWSPSEVDNIDVSRLTKIIFEAIEDNTEKKE